MSASPFIVGYSGISAFANFVSSIRPQTGFDKTVLVIHKCSCLSSDKLCVLNSARIIERGKQRESVKVMRESLARKGTIRCSRNGTVSM